jgi:TonB family protein
MKKKFLLLMLCLVTFAVTGCSSLVGSKNKDFIPGQSQVASGKNTIVICRPSAMNEAFNTAGLTINSSPATEIGSGEIYSIDVVKTSRLELQFTLPVTDLIANLWKPPTTFTLRLSPDTATHFIILSVDTKMYSVPPITGKPGDLGFESESTWTAKPVDAKTMLQRCGSYTPKFLVVKTLPQIFEKGVIPLGGLKQPLPPIPIPAITIPAQPVTSIKSDGAGKITANSSPPPVNISTLTVVYQPDADAYYPAFSKRAGMQGDVSLRLTVGEDGVVEDAEVIKSSSYRRLDAAGVEIGKRYRFKPFLVNGFPIRVSTTLLIRFNLKN